jgi:hypothetical protein
LTLALTDSAVKAVHALTSQPGLPEEAGLRIASSPTSQNGSRPSTEIELEVVAAPEPDDREIEELSVYLEPGTDELLAEKVLDAEIEGDSVRFSLRERAD